jgi:ribonuclease R
MVFLRISLECLTASHIVSFKNVLRDAWKATAATMQRVGAIEITAKVEKPVSPEREGDQRDMTSKRERRDRRTCSETAGAEATEAARRIQAICKGRSEVKGITIDGPTSKDLDDALWLDLNPQGGLWLHISIADVGSLLTPRLTPTLDAEAFERSFTRYTAHQGNIPMLPRLLSEDKMSLHEEQPRPTITISLPLDAQLTLGEPHVHRTFLRSSKRFHYQEVDEEIENPCTEFGPMLQEIFRIAQGLLQRRRAKGALALYDLYTGWTTTEEGVLVHLEECERHKAHIIVQECMILANQAFALFFAQRGLPALYRNHGAKAIAPERSVLLQMIDTAIWKQDGTHMERTRTTINLALERARYAPRVAGHFGLNIPAYIHMTSPLRRYPDLVNQRILHAALDGDLSPYTQAALETIATHVNEEEDRTKDAKKAYFLAEYDRELQNTITHQGESDRSLESLDAKQFHSILRMAAQGHTLPPSIEQEIYTRLENQRLYANDLFTCVFRFQNRGDVWERVKQAGLQWLQDHPHHAVSIFLMGQQALGWEEPVCEITAQGRENEQVFQARAQAHIHGQLFTSSLHTAVQKERAKQQAFAELLAAIAGVVVELRRNDAPQEAEQQQSEATASPLPPLSRARERDSSVEQQNYKGQLQELAQTQKWESPRYTEEKRSGPPHALIFTVEGNLTIEGKTYVARGSGKTKMQAEQSAAQQLLTLVVPFAACVIQPPLEAERNAVSVLNEMRQRAEVQNITYTYKQFGPPHSRTFECICEVITPGAKTIETTGGGKTKKEAAQGAALQAILFLSTGEGRDA